MGLQVGASEAFKMPFQALEKFSQREKIAKELKQEGGAENSVTPNKIASKDGYAVKSRIVGSANVALYDMGQAFKEAGLTVVTTFTAVLLTIPQLVQFARGKEIPGQNWGVKAAANHAYRTLQYVVLSPVSLIGGVFKPQAVKDMHVSRGLDNNQVVNYKDRTYATDLLKEIDEKAEEIEKVSAEILAEVNSEKVNSKQAEKLISKINLFSEYLKGIQEINDQTQEDLISRKAPLDIIDTHENITTYLKVAREDVHRIVETAEKTVESKVEKEKKIEAKKLAKQQAAEEAKKAEEQKAAEEAKKSRIAKIFDSFADYINFAMPTAEMAF